MAKKIAILTTFQQFDPWYSLTGIVKDQVRMLTEYNHEVFVFVNEQFNHKKNPFVDNPHVHVINKIPFAHLCDYRSGEPLKPEHEQTAQATCAMLVQTLKELEIDTVFTHDFVFTGWHKPYAIGLQRIQDQLPGVIWLHWIHSIPSVFSDWWDMAAYGPGHKLVYPNQTDIIRVAENYRTTVSSVKVIPHIKDLRVMFNFADDTCEIIDHYPALMQADVVQIYPASSDRFEAKRVSEVIRILAFIKSLGVSVCLFIANQWATTPKHYANIQEYYALGRKYDLEPGKDLIFSSAMYGQEMDRQIKFKVGVPADILYNLMQLANLFIFPTREETFGLVLPEVSLASGALCVLNRSLQMQMEVSGHNTLFFDFGSFTNNHHVPDQDEYLRQIAMIIMGRMQENDGILTRTFMRRHYNMDYLYSHYYAPIMAEMRINP